MFTSHVFFSLLRAWIIQEALVVTRLWQGTVYQFYHVKFDYTTLATGSLEISRLIAQVACLSYPTFKVTSTVESTRNKCTSFHGSMCNSTENADLLSTLLQIPADHALPTSSLRIWASSCFQPVPSQQLTSWETLLRPAVKHKQEGSMRSLR